jgi:hypothetical protein
MECAYCRTVYAGGVNCPNCGAAERVVLSMGAFQSSFFAVPRPAWVEALDSLCDRGVQ